MTDKVDVELDLLIKLAEAVADWNVARWNLKAPGIAVFNDDGAHVGFATLPEANETRAALIAAEWALTQAFAAYADAVENAD